MTWKFVPFCLRCGGFGLNLNEAFLTEKLITAQLLIFHIIETIRITEHWQMFMSLVNYCCIPRFPILASKSSTLTCYSFSFAFCFCTVAVAAIRNIDKIRGKTWVEEQYLQYITDLSMWTEMCLGLKIERGPLIVLVVVKGNSWKKKVYQMRRTNYNCTEQRCTQDNALTLVNTFLILRKWAIK